METKLANVTRRIGYNYDYEGVDPLYGDVEQVISRHYYLHGDFDDVIGENAIDDEIGGIVPTVAIYKFNDRGDCESTQRYDRNGNITVNKAYEYEYDEQGNLLSVRVPTGSKDESDWWVLQRKYDQNGRCIEELNEGALIRKQNWTYDSEGVLIESVEEDDFGKKRHIKYDSKGRVIEEIIYDAASLKGGQEGNRVVVLYSNGQPVEVREVYAEGGFLRLETFSYDAQGHLTTEENYDEDGVVIRRRQYTYNSDGLLTKDEVAYTDGSYHNSREFEYTPEGENICHIEGGRIYKTKKNTLGQCVEQASYDEESGAMCWKVVMTYDSHGNEVSRVEFETAKQLLTCYSEREITYR